MTSTASLLSATVRTSLEQRFGVAKVAILSELLTAADPLADAVITAYDGIGKSNNTELNLGIEQGSQSIPHAPAAVQEFLAEVENRPAWVDAETLKRGAEAYQTIGNLWITLSLSTGSLVHTYSSASIARVLVRTGNLTKMADRRLIETGMWLVSCVMPGGLERGALGYVRNLQVRLLHARVRTTLLKRGWDVAAKGMPINQVEMARTWLDFTYVPFTALQNFGISFTPAEINDLYHFWQYIAYLLGIDERLYRDITDNASAQTWLDLIDGAMEPANEDSRALTEAMLQTLGGFLNEILKLPVSFTFDFASAITRRLHGDTLSDQLGVKRTWVSMLMPLLVLQNRFQRFRLRRSPAVRQAVIDQTVTNFKSQLAQMTWVSSYEQNAHSPTQHPLPVTAPPPEENAKVPV